MAETHETTERIEHTVHVDAPPETVFEFFTDPTKLVRWMGSEAILDPRPGGVCRFDINGSKMSGEYVEVDFPSRIVFAWGWEARLFEVGEKSTAVEVTFTPDGEGTIVRLAHSRLPHGAVAFHRAGWGHYLERLAAAAAGTDPGPDPWRDVTLALRAIQAAGEG